MNRYVQTATKHKNVAGKPVDLRQKVPLIENTDRRVWKHVPISNSMKNARFPIKDCYFQNLTDGIDKIYAPSKYNSRFY